jgi:hypothetical protein
MPRTAACVGRGGLLLRRAGRLFSHLSDVLSRPDVSLGSPPGQEYLTILRTHLLAVPAYCARSNASTFQSERGGGIPPG